MNEIDPQDEASNQDLNPFRSNDSAAIGAFQVTDDQQYYQDEHMIFNNLVRETDKNKEKE